MPEKGKGSRRQVPTTPSAENATYQDPSTIERQQAPTGDLYAMPGKKPKYSEVQKQNVSNKIYVSILFFVFSHCFLFPITAPLSCLSFNVYIGCQHDSAISSRVCCEYYETPYEN